MNDRTCYIINFYLGERRKTTRYSYQNDKLYFLKSQIETLEKYSHSLTKIIFNFNIREEDYPLISTIFKITPKFIQGTEIEINFRENIGMSYGAWSDLSLKYKDEFDYFIFNEDDYFFIQNNWDSYLRDKYISYPDCGYLCLAIREPNIWNEYKKYAGHASGITSTSNLQKVIDKHGRIPFYRTSTEYSQGEKSQHIFSFSYLEVGLNIYDIRDDYKLDFAWTSGDEYDIQRFFYWNSLPLCTPARLYEFGDHIWYQASDTEFLDIYKPTTLEQALKCYNDKLPYYDVIT
jgi:hypothetical protein